MSRRVTCLECGAQYNPNQECWGCAAAAAEREDDAAFAAFMDHDEETRWRVLWTAAGKPTGD